MGRLTIEENFKEWNKFHKDWEKDSAKVLEFKRYCTTWGYEEEDVNKFLKKKNIKFETGRLQERIL